MSELSLATGVPVPTIKYYVRVGLLPGGTRTAPNQASYGEGHVRRLRLVRVLSEVGGLSLAAVRGVVDALEREDEPLHETLAAAHAALRRDELPTDPRLDAARDEIDTWLRSRGWLLSGENPARDDLAATLVALRDLGWPVGSEVFERYASHADTLAETEIGFVSDSADREAAVEATVVGTVLFERAFAALRRLAHEHHSRRAFGGRRPQTERSTASDGAPTDPAT